MTMVVITKFKKETVIIADSRASAQGTNSLIPSDSLAKIIPIGQGLVLCYAGSVSIVNKILDELKNLQRKREYRNLEGILRKVPKLAQRVYESSTSLEKGMGLALIVGGRGGDGQTSFIKVESPNFIPEKVEDFKVIGSGSFVEDYLKKEFSTLDNLPDSKKRIDQLRIGLEGELSKVGEVSVGGLFQIILISDKGIQPINHGYINLNPDDLPDSMSMTMEPGGWVQRNLAKNQAVSLLFPKQLLSKIFLQNAFYNYRKKKEVNHEKKYYLQYFLTSAGVEYSPESIRFLAPTVIGFVGELPYIFKTVLSVGFWGNAGKDVLKVFLVTDKQKKLIKEIPFEIEFFPESVDLSQEIEFQLEYSGVFFIEIMIGNQLLSRRVLYLHFISPADFISAQKNPQLFLPIQKEGMDKLVSSVDEVVEKGAPQLVYSFICGNYSNENGVESFENQMRVFYWKKYPLKLACYIASAFRMSKGEHEIRIDLVDASNQNITKNITTTKVISRSSCLITPMQGGFIVEIPTEGMYYVRTYIDNKVINTSLLIAETDNPQFSYSVFDEQIEGIRNGDLLMLAVRANQSEIKSA